MTMYDAFHLLERVARQLDEQQPDASVGAAPASEQLDLVSELTGNFNINATGTTEISAAPAIRHNDVGLNLTAHGAAPITIS